MTHPEELRALVNEKGLEAAELELSRVLAEYDYVMPVDGMHRVLSAYLLSSVPDGGWCTMESAPKDWSNVLLYDPEQEQPVFEGYYSCADGGHDCWMENRGKHSQQVFPTRWRPLPTAPQGSSENG